MPDTDALLTALEWISTALTAPVGSRDLLDVLAEHVSVVLGVTGAGVMMLQEGRLAYAASSTAAVAALQRVVEVEQAGPCVDAGSATAPVAIEDVCAAGYPERFPSYVEQAQAGGVRAVAAVPMVAGERMVGVLGLYDREPRPWDDADLRVASVLAGIVSGHVVQVAELDAQRRLTGQLQTALDTRVVIEQAKGVIAVERGIGIEEAFAFLRKQARDNNERLHDVCAAVVSRHQD